VASALLGVPSGASFSQPPELLLTRYSYAVFAQDDIRVNSRLTLNLGVRWDGEGPISDESNHVGYFDTALVNGVVKRPGTFRYAGVNGAPESILKGDFNNISPRVGFVFAADRARKTAIRGSASIITAPLPTIGYYAAAVGFEPLLQFVSPGAGLAALTLRNDYQLPAASGPLGDAAYLGQSFTQPLNRTLEAGRVYQWNFGIQREIAKNMVVEALYTGNRGTRLIGSQSINQIPQALAEEAIAATVRSGNPTSAVNLLNERLPNPLSGVVPGALGGATLTRSQLAVPFPQFSGITALTNSRDSIYHGLQMTLQRRLSSSWTFLVAYTFSKLIDNVATDSGATDANSGVVQNPYNLRDNRGPSSYDRPHYFTVTSIWALPFGRGKRFATSGIANAVLGGFSLNLALVAHGGGPLGISQSASNGLGVGSARPDVVTDPATASASIRRTVAASGNVWWVNPAAYALVNGRYGTAPARDSRLRGPGFQQWDIGLQRDFKIREPLLLKFRCEAFNAFNTNNLTNPVQNRSAADFGQINASFDPRVFQFGLELRF
jgi:hypothetical protein